MDEHETQHLPGSREIAIMAGVMITGLAVVALAAYLPYAIVGPFFIWCIIQWVNQRDDPHTAKRPPDPP